MPKTLSPQCSALLALLKDRPLTGREIEAEGIMNYKGRISDLRLHHGISIKTTMIPVFTRWGKGQIAQYSLENGGNNA